MMIVKQMAIMKRWRIRFIHDIISYTIINEGRNMQVEIIKPYGYCSGVKRVIDMIESIRQKHQNDKIYCIGQIVHNKIVNEKLKELDIDVLTAGTKKEIINKLQQGVVIFSAHGTDEKIINLAKEKGLIVYDVVCPFVKREFDIIKKKIKEGYSIIYIGKKKHEESEAAISISDEITLIENVQDLYGLNLTNNKIAVINQTTLSINDLKDIYLEIKNKFPNAVIIDEICNSTRIRQEKLLSINKDVSIIVVGDENSNNTKSLFKLVKLKGNDCVMIESYNDLNIQWLDGKKSVIIVSGASTPNEIVEEIYEKIKKIK